MLSLNEWENYWSCSEFRLVPREQLNHDSITDHVHVYELLDVAHTYNSFYYDEDKMIHLSVVRIIGNIVETIMRLKRINKTKDDPLDISGLPTAHLILYSREIREIAKLATAHLLDISYPCDSRDEFIKWSCMTERSSTIHKKLDSIFRDVSIPDQSIIFKGINRSTKEDCLDEIKIKCNEEPYLPSLYFNFYIRKE